MRTQPQTARPDSIDVVDTPAEVRFRRMLSDAPMSSGPC